MLLGNVFEDPEDCNQTGYFNIYYLQGFIMLTDNLGSGSEQENPHLNFAFVRCYHRIRKSWNDAITELGFFSFIFELFFQLLAFMHFELLAVITLTVYDSFSAYLNSALSQSPFLTACLFMRMNHLAPPLWFSLSFILCEPSLFDKFWSFLKIPGLVL